jgi:hypothetical protein
MNEPIYHVYANYCGERRLMFAGYASRVARRLGMPAHYLASYNGAEIAVHLAPTCDRYGNLMPYQLWSAPVTLKRQPNPEMEIAA